MELEKEIEQDTFSSEYHKAIVNILFSSSWITAEISRRLKPDGASHQQYNI